MTRPTRHRQELPERPRPPAPLGGPGQGRRVPPPDPTTQQRGWAAVAMGVLSLIGLFLVSDLRRGVYVVIVTLLIGATAAWLGVSANRRASRAGTGRPRGAVAGTVLGVLGLAFSAMLLIVFAVFWKELAAYSNCLGGANTLSAQQACQQQLSRSVGTEIKALQPRGD